MLLKNTGYLLAASLFFIAAGGPVCDIGQCTDGNPDCNGGPPVELEVELIDDLEDGDSEIEEKSGRKGYWYVVNDESPEGSQEPEMGDDFVVTDDGYDGSNSCAGTKGSGFTDWGAGLVVSLACEQMGQNCETIPYDASDYDGVTFAYRSDNAFRLKLSTPAVIPEADGGDCPDASAAEDLCYDAYGVSLPSTNGEWKMMTVMFDELSQEGWGDTADFEDDKIQTFEFSVEAGVDFDFCIDDLGFVAEK